MNARPNLCSVPAKGITIDGIVDVLGGRKSVVVHRIVGDSNGDALKGQILEIDSAAGTVKTATKNVALADVAGIAVSSAVQGEVISVLRHGIARMVVDSTSTALAVGDQVAVLGDGKVTKLGDDSTSEAIGYVAKLAEGYVPALASGEDTYVDVELNLLGGAV